MSDSSLYTYNVVIGKFEQFANAHALIRRFTHGQISQADLEKEGEWPWMHVTPTSFSFDAGSLTYSWDVYFSDIPRDKELKTEYQRQSMSECIQLAGDFVNMLENGTIFDESVVLGKPISAQPFIEEFSHVLTGVQLSIDITVDYLWNACEIPYGKQIINIYSEPIGFPERFDSLYFLCDGEQVATVYGDGGESQDTIEGFVNMLNENQQFLEYGTYHIDTLNTIRCEMPLSKYNELCGGLLTIQAFRD